MTIAGKGPDPHRGLDYLPGKLPVARIPDDTNVVAVSNAALAKMSCLLTPAGADFLTGDAIWRDQLAMTSTFRTLYSAPTVLAAWNELSTQKPTGWKLCEGTATILRFSSASAAVECRFEFETAGGVIPSKCSGFLRLVPGDSAGEWKLWCLQTILQDFKEAPMLDLRSVDLAQTEGKTHDETPIPMCQNLEISDDWTARVDVVIIGAGQAGLSAAGYLKALGVQCVVLEKHKEVGDQWTDRYESLMIHTPLVFNHLAFGPTFRREPGQAEWLSPEDLKQGFTDYVRRYDIASPDVSLSSAVTQCVFDEVNQEWTVTCQRPGGEAKITACHLILANGPGGTVPLIPSYRNKDNFKGDSVHSVEWASAAKWKGGKGIIIGSGNTGHDIAEDMLRAGLDSVTMIQRSKTFIQPRQGFKMFSEMIWPPGRSQELGDEYFFSPPTAISRLAGKAGLATASEMVFGNEALCERLEAVGFKVDHETDFEDVLLNHFGGHYLDHGCSAKIADGLIKVKSGVPPVAWIETGLAFEDGTTLDADIVVFATGFEKSTTTSADVLLGTIVAEKLDPYWGVDEEGEIRGAFKPCGFPQIWQIGGGFAHARYLTRFVALQIKADLLGKPLVPYTKTPEGKAV